MSNQGASGQGSQSRQDDNDREDTEDIASEYDLSEGVRDTQATAMRDSYSLVFRHSDGTTEVVAMEPRPETVVLERDVNVVPF